MVRVLAAPGAALLLVSLWGAPHPLAAQAWNDARTMALVARATELRARQLADTGLTDYAAMAHGYVSFLAQVGEGFPDPPKLVKADELALEVYWRAPNLSKQWIIGRRDTLLLPTDIRYHRDHLGIVQNNFPDIIRLGEGDEVRDVPHPLSPAGLVTYDYAIRDSLRLTIPGRAIDVYEVQVRPKAARASAVVGAVYLARDDAQVVRMSLSFTRAALIDPELEDVSIVLENALTEGRFWLPRRQEIEIRRTGTWLDFPARGIIRGRWEICCYQVNQHLAAGLFTGPEVVPAPPSPARPAHQWTGAILDSLPPDVRAASEADVRRVQEQARSLIRTDALARARRTAVAAPAASALLRVDRAQGLSLGSGVRRRLGGGLDATVLGRFGFSDHEAKGRITVAWSGSSGRTLRLDAFREYADASDRAETSGIRNSIAAQEFGSDDTEPWDLRGVSLGLHTGNAATTRWTLEAAWRRDRSVEVTAHPASGRFEPTLPVEAGEGPLLTLAVARSRFQWLGGAVGARTEIRLGREHYVGGDHASFTRAYGEVEGRFPLGDGTAVIETAGGLVSSRGRLPLQQRFFAGGPVSAPGFEYHQFSGSRLLTQRVEWQLPVPFLRLPLGRWGRVPARATLAPFVNLVGVAGDGTGHASSEWYPSVGTGMLLFFDLVRVDIARGLRAGRWTFGIDVSRDFWRIM